jgi:ubiquinone/menaquinone biosynthesis C-methylase UbiE
VNQTPYDAVANWYDEFVSSPLHAGARAALLELIGDITGQQICDLCSGQGVVSRQLAKRGARVVGIDIALRLLEIATRYEREEPLGIGYLHGDAQSLGAVRDASFDGVVCHLALMDIPNLDAALRTVARILAPGGWFAFTIVHPCFQTPHSDWLALPDGRPVRAVRGYFAEGFWRSENASGVRGKVGAYHRTLGTYLNSLSAAGLPLEELSEPVESGERGQGVPWLLLGKCRRI